ncbi:MAG TPA: hypothetical protein VMJ12_04195 [Candidatus Acidoferrales bacterium]|nr:hypothetical protein [Candidatus Acidoferrales bacterium]
MKTRHNATRFATVAVTLVSLSASVLWTNAGERFRSGSYETSRGRSGTFQQTINRQPGTSQRQTTVQTGHGVWAQQSNATWNRQAGTAGRTTVTTAPNGKTATIDQSAVRNGNLLTVDGSRTGYDGKTSDWNRTVTANGNGTASVNGQYTRQNGNTIDSSSTVTRTADGHATAGSYTTSTGKSGTFDTTVVNNDGTRTQTQTVTGANGKTANRVVITTRDDNTIDRTVTTTGPNGKTETHSGSVTFNQ